MSVARFFVLALLLGTPGVARDRHVSAATDHVNCGTTPATTFHMLQKAESVVQPGDFVLIGNGVYGGDPSQRGEGSALLLIRKSGLPGAWITWKARPGHTPLLRPRQRRLGHPHLPHVARRTSHVDIVNNTTYWNGSVSGYEELFPNRSTDIAILNNIIVPRPGGQVTSDNRNTGIVWDYNLYPVAQSVRRGPHDIVADPRFVAPYPDLLRADFRLTKGSPALESGTDMQAQPTDLHRIRRPITRDRGAYEQ